MKKLIFLVGFIITVVLFSLITKSTKAARPSAPTTCGSQIIYGGITYNTVIIGSQCWFKENINAGNIITNLELPDELAPVPNNPNTFSKWCYNDSEEYCNTEGGLYTWSEVNALPYSCNLTHCDVSISHQGICPTGWHVPTDADFYTLESYLTAQEEICDPARIGWGCYDAGTKLKLGGSSGFDAISAGNHETNNELSFFDKREPSIHFWLSSPTSPDYAGGSYAWLRTLGVGYETVFRSSYLKKFGMSVRCISNDPVVGPPTSLYECLKGNWKIFNNPAFENQVSCLSFFN